jgi:hypothetical protein
MALFAGGIDYFYLITPNFPKINSQMIEKPMCKKKLMQHHQELWHYI